MKKLSFGNFANGSFLLILTIFLIFPIYWMFNSMFQTTKQLFQNPPLFFPNHFNLDQISQIISENYPYFINSLIITGLTIIVTVIIAVPAAYSLAKLNMPFKGPFMLMLLITQMFPLVMLLTPLFINFSNFGLLNNYFAVALAIGTHSIPFSILILRSFMLSLSNELREAALIDGCNEIKTFLKIIIPNSLTGIMTVIIFTFLFAWGDFVFGLTLITDPNMQPATIRLYFSMGQYGTDWSRLMTLATLLSLPALLFVIFAQKAIANGIGNVSVNK